MASQRTSECVECLRAYVLPVPVSSRQVTDFHEYGQEHRATKNHPSVSVTVYGDDANSRDQRD
jgi:hypothetical protein